MSHGKHLIKLAQGFEEVLEEKGWIQKIKWIELAVAKEEQKGGAAGNNHHHHPEEVEDQVVP